MSLKKKIFVLLSILIVTVLADQGTKRWAENSLKGTPASSYLGNTFRLEYAENSGAFLGLGSTLPEEARFLLLTVFSGGILVLLGFYILIRKDIRPIDCLGYSLILGGGISNMIDRISAGVVTDFMNMGIGSLRTGIFNIADMVIMAGLGVTILAHYLERKEFKSGQANNQTQAPSSP